MEKRRLRIAVDVRVLADRVSFARYGDRHKFQPLGLLGGLTGTSGAIVLNSGTPGERRLKSKGLDTLAEGDLVSMRLPGAGGYGDPRKRDREFVAQDLKDGMISRESAARDYGLRVEEKEPT